MEDVPQNEEVTWTPRMRDRRQYDRRNDTRDFQTNGKSLNVSNLRKSGDRRVSTDRRQNVTVTITGRAIDVEDGRP